MEPFGANAMDIILFKKFQDVPFLVFTLSLLVAVTSRYIRFKIYLMVK